MCGITFFALLDAAKRAHADAGAYEVCSERIKHRGPDGSRTRRSATAVMGFHRLAIINTGDDTERGMQPFEDEGGRISFVCNGEIYNYRALYDGLLRSDVDVVLRVLPPLSSWNTDRAAMLTAVDTLDGDFAFVVATDGGRFMAARDHVGVRPLFYAEDDDGVVFALASEAKALNGAPGVGKVHVFPPGHVLIDGEFVPYHCASESSSRPGTPQEEVRELVEAAVAKRLEHSERPVGVLCSGGVDSAILTCLAAQRVPGLHVFTMEYAEGLSEDAFYARMLCERLAVKHTVVRFSRAEIADAVERVVLTCETYDPNTVRASVPMLLLAEHIARHTDVRVVLSGEGADELFAGYNYFRFGKPEEVRTETQRLLRNLHMFDLLRADRCFGSVGLEVRVPFLDQALVRYVTALPAADLLPPGAGEKLLLRDAFGHLEALRDLRILDRPKERFSDGCGFAFVPALLNLVSNGEENVLDKKLVREKAHYRALFEAAYGCDNIHLIVQRELPDWISAAGDSCLTLAS